MLAALCKEYGPPESLVVEEVSDPTAGPGEAVVRIEAAAANYPDVLIMANEYQVSVPTPFIPGSEYAGVVETVGEGVDPALVGSRVRGGGFVGAFCQRTAAPVGGLTPVPESMDFAGAAAYQVVYATAYHSLRSVAEVNEGDWVVVLGAAGGVGLAAVELAQLLGGRVLAAASSDEKLELCRKRGAEATVNYATESTKERIKELTGGGADVVIDPVGGPYSEEALRAMRQGGRFVTLGYASGEIPRIPLNLVLLKGVTVKGYEARTFGQHAPELAARDRDEMERLVAEGRIDPHVSATYPLAETGAALRSLADRRATGKVVILPWMT